MHPSGDGYPPWARRRLCIRLLISAWVVGLAVTTGEASTGPPSKVGRLVSSNVSNSLNAFGAETPWTPLAPSWVEGTWGEWSPWSTCSRTCGGGVAVQTRECRPPRKRNKASDKEKKSKKKHRKRSNGAKNEEVRQRRRRAAQCVGQYRRVHLCNYQNCPPGSRDFRTLQCEEYNKHAFSGRFYQWEPFFHAPEQCQLNCRARGFRFYATLNRTVVDGTPCRGPDSSAQWLCVSGTCQRVGCDGVLGSGARTDSCGVCGGDNSTCRIIAGIFTRPQMPPGYNSIALLPRGACNVTVAQMRPSRNLLSLKRLDGSLVVNSGWAASWPGEYEAAGTSFTYRHADPASSRGESLSAPGPLSEPLELLVMYQQPNPGIKYEYSLPIPHREEVAPPTAIAPPGLRGEVADDEKGRDGRHNEVLDDRADPSQFPYGPDVLATDPGADTGPNGVRRKSKRFVWRVTGMSACSKTCGGGTQQAKIECVRENNHLPVSEKRCNPQEKPASYPQRCNTLPCPAQWVAGDWSPCSVTCGAGVQTRDVSCRQEISSAFTVTVSDSACHAQPTLNIAKLQACRMTPCPAVHHPSHHHQHHHQHHQPRPHTPTTRWVTGPWSQCSADCGRGTRSRVVSCPLGSTCPLAERPASQETCDLGPCPTVAASAPAPGSTTAPFWIASEWSHQCSSACGTGVQTRAVVCSAGASAENLARCDASLRPDHTRACASDRDCNGQWFAASWGQCSTTCGQGIQSRGVACLQWQQGRFAVADNSNCPIESKPEGQRPCAERACPAHWYASEWNECSRSCGTGAQKREVRCIGPGGPSTVCSEVNKPASRKPCHLQDCTAPRGPTGAGRAVGNDPDSRNIPVADETQDDTADNGVACEDRLRNCHLVAQARLCKYAYYENSCCNSCRRNKGDN